MFYITKFYIGSSDGAPQAKYDHWIFVENHNPYITIIGYEWLKNIVLESYYITCVQILTDWQRKYLMVQQMIPR